MRTIKFRGKKTSDASWVYGSLVYSNDLDAAIYFQVGKGIVKRMDWAYVFSSTIGQFTGLHDKNGKEIYEGDIIFLEGFGRCFVRYNTDYCKFELRTKFTDGGFVDKLWSENCGKYEVIGNIYDNPN